jgi:hypothetical protein
MPTPTGPTVLYVLAETAVGALVNGAAYAIPTNAIRADVELFIAQVNTTAPTGGPPNVIMIQGCDDASDDTRWVDLFGPSTGTTAAVTTTLNGAVSAAATSITLTGSGTFGATTKQLYIRDSSTVGEWVKAQGQATNTLTVPAPGSVNSHLTGINVYDQAVRVLVQLDVACLKRLRVQVDNNQQATGPTLAVFALVNTYAN